MWCGITKRQVPIFCTGCLVSSTESMQQKADHFFQTLHFDCVSSRYVRYQAAVLRVNYHILKTVASSKVQDTRIIT